MAYQTLGDDIAMILGLGGTAAAIFFFVLRKKQKEFDAIEAAPEHAFKVEVSVRPIPVDSARVLRGRKVTHALAWNILISPKDWRRLDQAGVMDAELFDYPDQVTFGGERESFKVQMLKRTPKGAVQFYDLVDAQEAKEELLKSLYNLKDIVETQKSGVEPERFEI